MKYRLDYLLLFAFSLLFSPAGLTAQSSDIIQGYAVLTTNDTLEGEFYIVKIKTNVLRYRKSNDKNWQILPPEKVLTVNGDKGLFFRTHTVVFNTDTSRIFLERIVEGGYTLYEGYTQNQGNLFFFNSKEKPALIKVNPWGIETQVRVYFGACAEQSKVRLRYGRESLIRFIQKMNECAYPNEQEIVLHNKIKPKLNIGISTGFAYYSKPKIAPKVGFDFLSNAGLLPSTRPSFGIKGNLLLTSGFGVSAGIHLVDKSFRSDSAGTIFSARYMITNPNTGQPFPLYATFYYNYIFELNLKYLEIPLDFRVRLHPSNRNGLVLMGGVNFSIPVITEFTRDWGIPYRVESPPLLKPEPTLEEGKLTIHETKVSQPIIGVHGGIGWSYNLNKKSELEITLGYYWSREKVMTNYSGLHDYYNHFEMGRQRVNLSATFYFCLGKG